MYQICFGLHSGLCVYEEGMSWFLFWEGPSVVGDVNHTNRSLNQWGLYSDALCRVLGEHIGPFILINFVSLTAF